MARKLIKYGKFLMSVALIFCLMAPSYASLSASDGSAFVTKGEFDSALADFNARLTTFEAGINSKIDSQVTSYLDRNGIWSGVKQDLVAANAEWKYGFTTEGSYNAPYIINLQQDGGLHMTNRSMGKIGIYADKEGNIINKMTKSGLAIVNTKCDDADMAGTTCQCYVCSSTSEKTTFASDHFLFFWNATISFTQDGELLNSVSACYEGQFAGTYLQVPKIPANVLLMFVKKDRALKISYKNTLQRDNGEQWGNTLGWLDPTNGGNSRKWKVESIYIY